MKDQSMTADIIIGLDVGKEHHYAWVIDTTCKCLHRAKVQQDEKALIKLFTKAKCYSNDVLLVVDQPNNIGAFAVEVARTQDVKVAYLTGTRMRHAALLHAGNSKTDPKDAQVIAETAMRMPSSLQPVSQVEGPAQKLKTINGMIEDFVRTRTGFINRARVTLLVICPQLERYFIGPTMSTKWVTALITHYSSLDAIARAGEKRLVKFLERNCPTVRNKAQKAKTIVSIIRSQKTRISNADELWLSTQHFLNEVQRLSDLIEQAEHRAAQVADELPEYHLLLSMPGVGPKTAQTILMCVGDLRNFNSANELASYAGICPVTRQSGTSIRGERVNRGGNKRLKNALWVSAFASIKSHERSRQYYQAKRDAGKRHNAAVMCLARRRVSVLFAMLKNKTLYDDNYIATKATKADLAEALATN